MNNTKTLLIGARILSSVFRPTYYPVVGFAILFTLTYLSLLPWTYKLWIISLVYIFTVGMPMLGIYIYRKMHGWTAAELRAQHRRTTPYIINILSYLTCLHFVSQLHLPSFVAAIIGISLLLQCVCTVINIWWKISMHSAGAGALIGALVAYAAIFKFNPVWWLCAAILVSGLVNSSRIMLRQHTLWQVLGGTWVGFLCGLMGILV